MRSSPLPDDLPSSFTVSRGRELGLSTRRMRAGDLDTPFHGVRTTQVESSAEKPGSRESSDELEKRHARIRGRAGAYAARMGEHEFFSHLTAAVLWGLPLPREAVASHDLHVSVFAPRRAPRCRGVIGHQARPGSSTVRVHRATGLRVSSPASTWASLATMLEHPYDLIAVADALVHIERMPGGFAGSTVPPLSTVEELNACVGAARRVGIGLFATLWRASARGRRRAPRPGPG